MTTIKDIAREANVSTGTVDRVLHNRGGVSPKTSERITKILKNKNFKINPIASSLAMKKHLTIATLIPSFDDENLFWKSPHSGIKKASQEVNANGVEIKNFSFDQFEPKNYMEVFKRLINSNPDAIIMVPVFINETSLIIKSLNEKNIPFIFLNINQKGYNNLCYIGQKSFEAGGLAGQLLNLSVLGDDELLIVQTRKNIEDNSSFSQRGKGFIDYFEKNKIKKKIHQIQFDGLKNQRNNEKKINTLLKSNKRIKGIVILSSRAADIIELIHPEIKTDMKVVGFDTTPKNVYKLKKGQITFLISQKSFNQGYKSIITMVNYLIHKLKPDPEIPTPLEIVTKENVDFIEYDMKRFNKEI